MVRWIAWMLTAWLAAASPAAHATAPLCHRSAATDDALLRLRGAMAEGRFITYEPTSVVVVGGRHVARAEAGSIRDDLVLLRRHFDALLTYEAGNGLELVPAIAESLGFRAMLVGVWNPGDAEEVALAIRTAREHPGIVLGLMLGNETLYRGEHGHEALARAIAAVRAQAPELLLATSEPFDYYQGDGAVALRAESDLLLPNIHPVYAPWFTPGRSERQAARMVRTVVDDLRREFCGPVLVKETGEPTNEGEEGYSEAHQATFWAELRALVPPTADEAFAYFSAFDLPWRAADGGLASEAHWGLYDHERRAKPVVAAIDAWPGEADESGAVALAQ